MEHSGREKGAAFIARRAAAQALALRVGLGARVGRRVSAPLPRQQARPGGSPRPDLVGAHGGGRRDRRHRRLRHWGFRRRRVGGLLRGGRRVGDGRRPRRVVAARQGDQDERARGDDADILGPPPLLLRCRDALRRRLQRNVNLTTRGHGLSPDHAHCASILVSAFYVHHAQKGAATSGAKQCGDCGLLVSSVSIVNKNGS